MPLKILSVHNKYKFRGGEDEARESDSRMLASKGHNLRELVFDNAAIGGLNVLKAGIQASWSPYSYKMVVSEIRNWSPDIVDIHNFFPLASPSVHYAARRCGVPVVQTLHNYRLLCPAATFFRNGAVCEDCVKHSMPWPALVHKCYRGSAAQTAAVSTMIGVHRVLKTWENVVSVFIAVSEFAKRKFVENGFPESKIVVKPNFVLDPGLAGVGGQDFIFVGRLAVDKGVRTLIKAMEIMDAGTRLKIVGDGPLEAEVRAAAERDNRIQYLGRLPQPEVLSLMGSAKCLIFPSELYETFGRVAAEAFAQSTPVIASRIGAVAEIVDHGRTGLLFTPGDAHALASAMTCLNQNPNKMAEMRIEARREFEQKYTMERNYSLMMAVYQRALSEGVKGRTNDRSSPSTSPHPRHAC